MRIQTSRATGFTLVEIMVVVAIIGLLAAIALPNFVRARTTSQTNACIENLAKIEGAKHTWALDTKKIGTATPGDGDLFGDSLYIREKPQCPASGTYSLNSVNLNATCTIPGHTL